MNVNTLSTRKPAALSRQLLAILAGSLAAVIANVIFYFFLRELAGVEFIAPSDAGAFEVSPQPVTDVIIFSIVYCLGASIVFLIVANRSQRPATVFVAISVVVLLLSLLMPLSIPTPPIPMATKISLAAMHVVGAAVLVPLLVTIGLPLPPAASE